MQFGPVKAFILNDRAPEPRERNVRAFARCMVD